jgi:amino acid adenylation domain-containing protein
MQRPHAAHPQLLCGVDGRTRRRLQLLALDTEHDGALTTILRPDEALCIGALVALAARGAEDSNYAAARDARLGEASGLHPRLHRCRHWQISLGENGLPPELAKEQMAPIRDHLVAFAAPRHWPARRAGYRPSGISRGMRLESHSGQGGVRLVRPVMGNQLSIDATHGAGIIAPGLAGNRRVTTVPPAECWLDLAVPPLDLNGPTALPYRPLGAGWVERPILELFRKVAEQYSDRIAVADSVRELSYRHVWNGACRLAQRIEATAAFGGPVGIFLPNGAHYPVAVLGCLAAARPCVVLDRYYPAERNLAIIRDAGLAAIVIATSDRGEEAVYPRDIAAIAVDPEIALQAPLMPPPDRALAPDDAAVIIYTSGSTGEPKGIVLSQRAILHRAGQLIDSLHLSDADRLLPLGSPCTIAGIQQLLEALLAGALLVKLDLQREGFGAVLDMIRDRRVTVLFATPSLLRSLARLDGAGEQLGSLRCVHPSGEVLLGADLELLRRCLSASCSILVVYGLTEAPAICQWFVPRGSGEEEGTRVAVGYRLPGYDCAVLDEDDRPLGFDETGELVVRSRYTALGEWQGGRLVPARFCADPDDPSRRILRTGDLVRLRADGVIVVVGRKDRQVQIRGMRVEPYEIENVLRRSSSVLDAAVVAPHDGERVALVAFVVLRPEEGQDAIAGLRERLRAALPAHMQPARIVPIEALPLLPGCKVDVDALLALDAARPDGDAPAAPASAGQPQRSRELVAQTWERILDRSALAADTPLDQAGGDSLKLLQLVFELEAQCGIMLPLSAFDLAMRPSELARTLHGLLAGSPAAALAVPAQLGAPRQRPPLVLLAGGDRDPPVFVAHGLGGLADLISLGRNIGSGHPVYGLQADGFGIDRIEDIARDFAESIEALQLTGPCLLIGASLGGLIMLETARCLTQRGREIGLLALLDTYPPPTFWPWRGWFWLLVRRSWLQVAGLTKLAPSALIPRLRYLRASFMWHMQGRLGLASRPLAGWAVTGLSRSVEGLTAAGARYRPRFYPGKLTFLKADAGDAPVEIWEPWAEEIEVVTVPGTHGSILRSASLSTELANCIDRALGENR